MFGFQDGRVSRDSARHLLIRRRYGSFHREITGNFQVCKRVIEERFCYLYSNTYRIKYLIV